MDQSHHTSAAFPYSSPATPRRRQRDRLNLIDGDAPPLGIHCDLICFSHLRWDFVFQRPQHLLTRFARRHRVLFVEEPVPADVPRGLLDISRREPGLYVATPRLPASLERERQAPMLQRLLDQLLERVDVGRHMAWYYTPMALAYSRHLQPEIIVYDCMDELSAFRNAPAELLAHEEELLHRADIVFTGGHSLYESKRHRHHAVHAFPSSIDKGHFGQAREALPEPDDQAGIGSPRIGFAGVIDERMDLALLRGVAERRPDWHIVMIGPVVKIDEATLPRNQNIHYLGQKPYGSLPAYMSHWNAAILPFAHNESTRFISPTKTPEYLAAGLPVVSTSIRDVVRPYGALDLVRIADAVDGFVEALDLAITRDRADAVRWARIDAYLSGLSWDRTWESMARLISRARLDRMNRRRHRTPVPPGQERRRVALVQNGYPSRFHDRREAAR